MCAGKHSMWPIFRRTGMIRIGEGGLGSKYSIWSRFSITTHVACVHRQANAVRLQLLMQAVLLNEAESTDDNKKDCHSSSHCDKYRCLLMLEKVCNSVTFLLHVEAWFGFIPESLSQERISKVLKCYRTKALLMSPRCAFSSEDLIHFMSKNKNCFSACYMYISCICCKRNYCGATQIGQMIEPSCCRKMSLHLTGNSRHFWHFK